MARTLIKNATIFDATGAKPFVGDLVVDGNRIASVAPAGGQSAQAADAVIDATGMFMMPGMTEGHAHLSFHEATCTDDLVVPPPEEQVLQTARTAELMLDMGFTSCYSASEAKLRMAVAVRNEINAGRLKGPRIRAGSLEISVTGALGDEAKLHNPKIGPSMLVDGPEEMRKAVRLSAREGCDNIKLDISGDPFYPDTPGTMTTMSFEEVKMAVDTAHALGKQVCAHARSIGSIQHCLNAGVDMIYHAEYTDEETLDMLEAARDRVLVAPVVGLWHTMINEGEPWLPRAVVEAMGIPQVLEESIKSHTEMRKRGIRHLIGGDYGFKWNVQGTQARDIGYFMNYFGYSAEDALICATRNGGLAMRPEGDLGTLEAGKLADLILVNGNVLADVSILADRSRIAMVMKDGAIHSLSPALQQQR